MRVSIRPLGFILLALAIALPATSQLAPKVGYPIHFDISPPMRDVVAPPHGPGAASRPLLAIPRAPQAPQFDPVMQSTPGSATNTVSSVNFIGVGVGLGNYSDCCAPPDTNMAVGPNHIVQWVNASYAVFTKAGAILPNYPKAGNSFWAGFGGPCETTNSGDPIAQYDRAADRWVMSQVAIASSYYQCFAVSTTADPTGSYARYSYNFGSALNDYAKITVWPVSFTGAPQGAYFASYNMFASAFLGPNPCAYDRAAMLTANGSATQICYQQSNSVGSLLPTDWDGATLPPSEEPNFYFDFGTNELLMWKFTPNFATPASSSFTGPTHISVASFSEACGGGSCIPQSETTQQLDSLADRLMYRNAYRNFGDHEAIVINHSITAGSSTGVRWYEVRNPNATPTVFQQGTLAPDSSYRWMGSIAMDQNGDIAVGYSVSSSLMHPAIRFTGREPTDALGTMQMETSFIEGTGSQLTINRWGDYSAMRIDPSDDCTFWYTTEYLKQNGTFNWSTGIASFKFNSCGGTPPAPAPPPNAPSSLGATAPASHEIDLSWIDNSSNESGFKIERCTGASCDGTPGSYSQIAQVGANVTTYSDTTVVPSTTYSYRVKAFNSGGDSSYSNSAQATTPVETPPGAPSNLTATPTQKQPVYPFVDLSWNDNSNNETNFLIERCMGAGCINFTSLVTVGVNVTTYHDTGVGRKATYVYRVKARNGAGDSAYSNSASATTR
jgi:hypothetical protein